MTESEYRAHPAISRSALFKITESPEKFRYYMDHPEEPTPALLFGQFFHKMVLQPETLWDEFIVAPQLDRRTKSGKEEYASFLDAAKDKTVVTEEMLVQATEMAASLDRSPYARRLLDGMRETPRFWTDDLTGEACKCRTDCETEVNGMPFIVDLKSAASADTDSFMREAIKYGYDMQAAMYCEGVRANTSRSCGFIFIVVEKNPPYAVNILQADDILIRRGYDLFRELIGIYHDCKETGNWYGYLGRYNMINNLSLPSWLAKEIE